MSRTGDVIKNKNKVEKARKARRKNEMLTLRNKSAFKAKLYDELQHVEVMLQDEHVDAVMIAVPDKFLSQFGAAIYSEDLAGYEITQAEGETNKFFVRRRFLQF